MTDLDTLRERHRPGDGDNDAGIIWCKGCGDLWELDGCDARVALDALDEAQANAAYWHQKWAECAGATEDEK